VMDMLREEEDPVADRADAHQGIADWYMSLFRTCGDVEAALESVSHRLSYIQDVRQAVDRTLEEACVEGAIIEIGVTLALMRPRALDSAHLLTTAHVYQQVHEHFERVTRELQGDQAEGLDARSKQLAFIWDRYTAATACHVDAPPADNNKAPVPLPTPRVALAPDRARELEQISINTIGRRYANAADLCSALVTSLGLPDPRGNSRPVRDEQRGVLEWATGMEVDIPFAIRFYRRYQLLLLYMFELDVFRSMSDEGHLGGRGNLALLQAGERCYNFATGLLRYVADFDFVQRENAILRTTTGIVLSWLGRHVEAQRCYNESYGYLNHARGASLPRLFATVDLRRAQTSLCQVQLADPALGEQASSPKTPMIALIYDAVSSVHRADYKIRGSSVNAHWFTWRYDVELSICCQIAMLKIERGIARTRAPGMLEAWFSGAFRQGAEVAGGDVIRLTRYLQLMGQFKRHKRVSKLPGVDAAVAYCTNRLDRALAKGDVDPAVAGYGAVVLEGARAEATGA
jgi:hypothetical protein